jgi:hypothetical protein
MLKFSKSNSLLKRKLNFYQRSKMKVNFFNSSKFNIILKLNDKEDEYTKEIDKINKKYMELKKNSLLKYEKQFIEEKDNLELNIEEDIIDLSIEENRKILYSKEIRKVKLFKKAEYKYIDIPELIYLSQFDENLFISENSIKEIIDISILEIDIFSLDLQSILYFSNKFPLFSLILLDNTLRFKKEKKENFEKIEDIDEIEFYLEMIKNIIYSAKYLKNDSLFLEILPRAFNNLSYLTYIDIAFVNKNEFETKINQIYIDFIRSFENYDQFHTISLFYIIYELLEKSSFLKPYLLNDKKIMFDFVEFEKNSHLNIDLPKPELRKKYTETYKKITNNYSNLRKFMIEYFPQIFLKIYEKNLFENKLELTKSFFNIILIFEFDLNEEKLDTRNDLSIILNILDGIIEKNILHSENKLLIINLSYTFCCYKLRYKDKFRGFQNIFMAISRKFLSTKNIFSKKNLEYLFIHILFLKFSFRESFAFANLSHAFCANFYKLNSLIEKKSKKLEAIPTSHLLNIFQCLNYNDFLSHPNLINEIEKRFQKIFLDIENNPFALTYLITGMVLSRKRNDVLFKLVLKELPKIRSTKMLLNIVFHIIISGYDKVEDFMPFFDRITRMIVKYGINYFNEFDRRQINEGILYLIMNANIDNDDYNYKYLMRVKKMIYFNSHLLQEKVTTKWFLNIKQNLGLSEYYFRNYLKRNNIQFEYQKILFDIFDVDFFIGNEVIINMNGPMHNYINGSNDLNLKSELKTKYFRYKGYYVVDLSYFIYATLSHKSDTCLLMIDYIKSELPENVYKKHFEKIKIN